ncbi:MAG: 4Fe-4S binding protein [Candidatus Hydrogenedentes bacterium]|nr:4Fe-4S binding protein [Candidatus Hydrogenedentota bacterium]
MLRRVSQALFLGWFLGLLFAARELNAGDAERFDHFFFQIDPLIQIFTWFSARTLATFSLLAVGTLLVTVLLGRVFCGWMCPLGTLHHFFGWLGTRFRRPKDRLRAAAWTRAQNFKYFLLAALLVMALFGAHWIGIFDPISLLQRTFGTAVLPALQYALEDSSTAVYQADPQVGPLHATLLTEPAYQFTRDHVFTKARKAFLGGVTIFAVFLGILGLNFFRNRFWCRYICPTGALLGLFSRRPALRLKNDASACKQCDGCLLVCPAGAEPHHPGKYLPTECYACWNCVAACKFETIKFKFARPLRRTTEAKLDAKRRSVVTAAAAGVVGFLLLRVSPQAQGKTYNPVLIRPPGALPEREFLQRCLQCGLCMDVCPTNALHPAWTQAGLEGLWTPVLVPQHGFCEYACNLCGKVCPTQAIQALPMPEKKKVKIGMATFDTTRCLPYAYGRSCIVCEEHCPIPTKAIYFVETEVTLRDGAKPVLKQPRVDAELCIGCGICENKCVFEDRAAVRITSANETRHPQNQPILAGGAFSSVVADSYAP